jgi:hypothetical protein|tara:strand:- start:89 stop:604 length:516 start_codon:yes stop_codon:yes gene_type:complete
MKSEAAIASIIVVVLINAFYSINVFQDNKEFYVAEMNKLLEKNEVIQTELNEFHKYGVEVDVTMYQPVYPQTDMTPNITADGTRFRISKASDYKYVALSRNLLKRWGGPFDYGDFILLKGTDHKDGVYQVRDTMNPKWVNMVDILESTDVKPYKYIDAQIYKMTWVSNVSN